MEAVEARINNAAAKLVALPNNDFLPTFFDQRRHYGLKLMTNRIEAAVAPLLVAKEAQAVAGDETAAETQLFN
jgi:hypothetical protein